MSPRIPVLPLSHLCVKLVSNILIQVLSDEEGLNYEAVREYLSEVTHGVLQDILKNILNSINLDAATRFSCLEILLRNDVRTLDTGIFPHSYYEKILQVIIMNGKGLQQVNMKGVWVRDHPGLLSQLVSSLNNLRVLIIPHMANDAVLECVSECKNLNILDISGEASFTENGVNYLKNVNLHILDIGNYGKKEVCEDNLDDIRLIATTIRNLPNLKSIRTYSYTGSAVSILHCLRCSETKLTYLHDTETTNETFDAILKLCRNLESIHIDSPQEGVIPRLKHLKRLICLKLTKPVTQELTDYLLNFGSNLEILRINHNKRESLDLSNIATGSSRVHTMEFYQMHLILTEPDVFFMSLENIEILYCDISDYTLQKILSNSPFLKRVLVGCNVNFSDGDIFRLCAKCDFAFLEELWLSSARNLTLMSVELLMGHCPNLRIIGQMSGWDISSGELDFFRSVLKVSNIDLTLLPFVL